MKYSYMHHKTRTCPATHPYYNISEVLCYDQCAVGWYGDVSTMTCQQCLYDCFTCSNGTACATCDSTVDHRIKSLNRCPAGPGYYDTGVNDPVAAPCTSPCATCVTSATYCLSCVTGYYLSSSSCLSCSAAIPSCNQCSNSSFC
jgi:proprotein convertase subtilisin/kexin type 5